MGWVMAADDLKMSELLDEHGKRLDEHGKRLGHIDERLNSQAARISRHEQILVGDDQLGLTGLVTQLKEISLQLEELTEWRMEVVMQGRTLTNATLVILRLFQVVIGIMAAIGINVWWPAVVDVYGWLVGG